MSSSHLKTQLTPEFLTRSLQLKLPVLSNPDLPYSNVTTDSRRVQQGSLFVALKGEKLDGHDFIESSISKGARGVLCQKGGSITSTKDVSIFGVDDPLAAYRKLSGAWRREFSIPLIVIAGSAGKTTTKEFLAAILSGKWKKIVKTQASQNGFIGIPMTLLEITSETEAAVIEVGIDEIGAMQQHMSLISASAAVLTAIGPEHLEKLQDIPTVAREEGIALTSVSKSGGIIVINLDDPWIKPHATTLHGGRKIPFSIQGRPSNLDMISGTLEEDQTTLTYEGLGIRKTSLRLPLLGMHNASNLLAAIALAAGLGLNSEEIEKGLKSFKGAEGRSDIRELPGNTPVICDYYNAQPASVHAAFELLTQISKSANKPAQTSKIRWACLGDMLDLGPTEEQFHRDLANQILDLKVENLLLYGNRMAALFDELKQRGFRGHLSHFTQQADLAQALLNGVKPGDAILIKGSRGMKMEEVWKILEPYGKSQWSRSPQSKSTSPNS